MHSQKYDCDYQFKYDSNGRIMGFEILGEVNKFSSEHTSKLFQNVPDTVGDLKQYARKINMPLIEVKQDLSFEVFWNQYNYKEGGSKKKTEAVWNRMSEKDKTMAINHLPRYERHLILTNVSKAYAITYLNQKRWEN